MGVLPGSSAGTAGLMPQDLDRIGERDSRSLEDMGKALRLRQASEPLIIQIIRDGGRYMLSLRVRSGEEKTQSRRH